MRIEKTLIALSLVLSLAAIGISVASYKKQILGTSISAYDLSSPETTLKSINKIVHSRDFLAAWELFRIVLDRDTDPTTKLYFSSQPEIKVLKSIEVDDSGYPENNGLIVSFVRFSVSGVDYKNVQYFRKDQLNRFFPADAFFLPYKTEKKAKDESVEAAIKEFEKTGNI